MLLSFILSAAAPPAACPPETPRMIAGKDAGRARPLANEPPAKHYLAVRHTENGCAKPILVGERQARGR